MTRYLKPVPGGGLLFVKSPNPDLDSDSNLIVVPLSPEEERLIELREMPYLDYLETPEWLEKRAKKFAEVGPECQRCGSVIDLEVHHLHYRNFGREQTKDLLILCSACHKRYHRYWLPKAL